MLAAEEAQSREQLERRIAFLERQQPAALLDEMETVGEALRAAGRGEYAAALEMLEPIAEQGRLLDYFQCAQLPYMIGVCREKLGDAPGALVAFEEALTLDPGYELALAAKERLVDGGLDG